MFFLCNDYISGIPGSRYLKRIRPIQGLSRGQKYYIKNQKGQEMLLVLGDISACYRMEKEKRWIEYLNSQDISTNRLLDFGVCNRGKSLYMMLSWIPGMDIQKMMKSCNKNECTQLGESAGKLLRRIHNLLPLGDDKCELTITEIIEECLLEFSDNNILLQKYPSMLPFLRFLEKSRDFDLGFEQRSVLHGDYHAKNLIYSEGTLSVIDWVYGTVGNIVEDFVQNVINAISSPIFASAQIDSYFEGMVPDMFWRVLAIYTAIHELKIMKYDLVSPKKNISFIEYQHQLVLKQYDDMKSIIPAYYRTK